MGTETRGLTRRELLRRTAYASAFALAGGLALPAALAAAPEAAGGATVVPTWLPSPLKNVYDPARCVYNYKASNTTRHLAGLEAVRNGTATAAEVFIGDSITDGYIGTAFDRAHSWPMVYRNALAQRGITTVGSGWVRAADFDGHDPRWSFDTSWHDVYVVRYAATAGATAVYADPMAGTSVALLFSVAEGASFTVSVDGATSGAGYRAFSAGSQAYTNAILTLTGLANTAHHVVIRSTSAATVVLEAGKVTAPGAGLVVHNMAQAASRACGSDAYSWTNFTGGGPGMYYANPARYPQPPSTVWIALGANDAPRGTSATTYAAAVRSIAAKFPASDIFLVLTYQGPWATVATWTSYARALYALADSLDVPLFDEWAKLGGYTTYSANGYAGDTIGHLNDAGYAVLGNWVASVAAPPA